MIRTGLILSLACLVLVSCDSRRTPPVSKKKPNVDTEFQNSVVPDPNASGPQIADWEGKSFIGRADAEAMGANMKSPDPVAYSRDGSAHKWSLGLDEINVWIWPYTDSSGASDRYAKSQTEDKSWCQIALKMNKATLAECVDSGMGGNSYLKRVVRSDGYKTATITAQKGKFCIKVTYAENKEDLNFAIEGAKKAADYVIKKLP